MRQLSSKLMYIIQILGYIKSENAFTLGKCLKCLIKANKGSWSVTLILSIKIEVMSHYKYMMILIPTSLLHSSCVDCLQQWLHLLPHNPK